jgi:hypothetical protein
MSNNVDDRLVQHWLESQRRQQGARSRLASSSLPTERFEGWALDLIADALSAPETTPTERAPLTRAPGLVLDIR